MSATFFDLMRYAATGIASPDMTGFDKLRSLAAIGGYPVRTITGVPPISFKADGKPLTAWSIAGNGQQTGTPTPDAPIMPDECGDRTANLVLYPYTSNSGTLDGITWTVYSDGRITGTGETTSETNFFFFNRKSLPLKAGKYTLSFQGEKNMSLILRNITQQINITNIGGQSKEVTFTIDEDIPETDQISLYLNTSSTGYDVNIDGYPMLNAGETALPYEPYGYKIPLSLSPTPIYLDEPLRRIGDYADPVSSDGTVTRRIKKLVLTGEETFSAPYGNSIFYASSSGIGISNHITYEIVCSHFIRSETNAASQMQDGRVVLSASAIYMRMDNAATADDFKYYLAQQYAAGTPVTVWYVLATPTTETITTPTLTTAKGSNVLTVDTTLQPSAVSVTGHIKSS